MEDKDITDAKMQVQGQMAAQYIQEVMQVRGPPRHRRARLFRLPTHRTARARRK